MLATVPATGCSLDDLNCVCSNEDLTHTLSACMLANCTMADTTGTARVQADLCDLSQESKRMQVFLYTGIVYSLAFLFVVLRIAGKMVSSRLSLDDIMVVAALLLTAVPLGCVLASKYLH
jgi:putative Ca2+/H+ antiporter (TMEM165/GDT1 family)